MNLTKKKLNETACGWWVRSTNSGYIGFVGWSSDYGRVGNKYYIDYLGVIPTCIIN